MLLDLTHTETRYSQERKHRHGLLYQFLLTRLCFLCFLFHSYRHLSAIKSNEKSINEISIDTIIHLLLLIGEKTNFLFFFFLEILLYLLIILARVIFFCYLCFSSCMAESNVSGNTNLEGFSFYVTFVVFR